MTQASTYSVVEHVEADRSITYAVQRRDYFVSDGYIFRRELIAFHDTRAAAEADRLSREAVVRDPEAWQAVAAEGRRFA